MCYMNLGQLMNSRFAKQPSPAINCKIWKTLYSFVFLCFFRRRHTFDILMLLCPLKMLSFNFCNVMNWTRLDLTGTMVDLPDTMVDLPDTMVDLPDTMVDLPDTMVDLPDTMVDLPNAMLDLPDTMLDLLNTMVDLPDTMVNLPDTKVDHLEIHEYRNEGM